MCVSCVCDNSGGACLDNPLLISGLYPVVKSGDISHTSCMAGDSSYDYCYECNSCTSCVHTLLRFNSHTSHKHMHNDIVHVVPV